MEHAAGVTMPTVLDGGDVDVERITFFEWLVVGNSVANLVIDRSANRLGVRLVAARGVVQRGGNALLHIDHEVMAQLVNFIGGHASFDKRCNEVQNFGGQSAGYAHALNVFGGFDGDGHEANYPRHESVFPIALE